jgi:hypothetical protein
VFGQNKLIQMERGGGGVLLTERTRGRVAEEGRETEADDDIWRWHCS